MTPDLSSVTLQKNAELENRVAELEVELLVWKQAHSVALEASERDTKAHNVQLAALNRQISNMDNFKTASESSSPSKELPKLRYRTTIRLYSVQSTVMSSCLRKSSLFRVIRAVDWPPKLLLRPSLNIWQMRTSTYSGVSHSGLTSTSTKPHSRNFSSKLITVHQINLMILLLCVF